MRDVLNAYISKAHFVIVLEDTSLFITLRLIKAKKEKKKKEKVKRTVSEQLGE